MNKKQQNCLVLLQPSCRSGRFPLYNSGWVRWQNGQDCRSVQPVS